MESEEALQRLLDRSAIHDVIMRYARGVDLRDWDLVASLFTPGALYEFPGRLGGEPAEGIEAILRCVRSVERFESTHHLLVNQLVEIDGDTANAETYATGHNVENGGLRYHTARNVYYDRLVCRDGRWLFTHWLLDSVWRSPWHTVEADS